MQTLDYQFRDSMGIPLNFYNAYPFTNTCYSNVLTAETPVSIIIPDGARIAVFGRDVRYNIWVGLGDTFNAPSSAPGWILLEDGDSLLLEDGDHLLLEGGGSSSGSLFLNPDIRLVTGGVKMWLYSENAASVSVSFYSHNPQNINS